MEQTERDMLIQLDTKMNNICGTITDLSARIDTQYATKDYVELRLREKQQTPTGVLAALTSRPVIVAITIIICLAIMGAAGMFQDNDQAQMQQYVQDQIKALTK